MKVKRRWIILMAAMTLIAIAGVFVGEPAFECDWSVISAADVAWLITATWVVIGFSLCFGDDIGGIIGNPLTFPMFHNVGGAVYTTPAGNILGGATIPLALYALFQMKFAIITPSLITGSFAERVRFSAYMFFMMFFFFMIYCPLAHMTWHPEGLFCRWGVIDFAGGIVVHASSGVAALAGAIYLGRRKAETRRSEPANIPFVLLGAALLCVAASPQPWEPLSDVW